MITSESIGITIGDPSGVGPDIVAAAIARADDALRRRLRVFCDTPVLERAYARVAGERVPADLDVINRGQLGADQAVPGVPSAAGGRAQVGYLEAAVSAARGGAIGALVTAPISKRAARAAGFGFAGHTEFLAERLKAERVAMMFVGPRLKVVLATVHLPLAQVPAALTEAAVVDAVCLGAESLRRDFGVQLARIGVVGLNPHAGEGGLFGREELEVIDPAIEECRRRLGAAADVAGPLVPDAAFRHAVDGRYDLVAAMYHDQGLIPVKLVDFEQAVNVTLGLPIIRTSPDHGVAYDVAAAGEARPDSFQAALDLAVTMLDRRRAES